MGPREEAVRAAFAIQAGWCAKLGSPFTSRLCEAIGQNLDGATELGRRVLDWPGDPDAGHDSVPLRLCGGLHALVRAGRLPDLAAFYPPNPIVEADRLWPAVRDALAEAEAELLPWLDLPPQTNEVARSAVLMSGLAVAAAVTGLPLALYELGASAGLNLLLDRYDVQLGPERFGNPGSPVRLAPEWEGPPPPAAPVRVVRRRGVDISPVNVAEASARERLLGFVWPDQAERLARLEAALVVALRDPPVVDWGDAADWIAERLPIEPERGVARVVMHSIAFQYFPPATQDGISAHLEKVGAAATADAPVAWLRYELDGDDNPPSLRLRLWPDGSDRLLARAHPHGSKVRWLA